MVEGLDFKGHVRHEVLGFLMYSVGQGWRKSAGEGSTGRKESACAGRSMA